MRTFRRRASRKFAGVAVVLLLPTVLAACPGTGGAAGTLHITLVDVFDGNLGGGPLGAEGHSTDQLVGDLTAIGTGQWRGVVDGSTDTTIKTTVGDQECTTHNVGTQQIEVTGTKGTFGDSNFKLQFIPKAAPSYTSAPSCDPPPPTKASNGIDWLEFNNAAYDSEGSMFVTLPDRPGGTWQTSQGQGDQEGDPCTFLAPLLGCTWTRTFTVEYR